MPRCCSSLQKKSTGEEGVAEKSKYRESREVEEEIYKTEKRRGRKRILYNNTIVFTYPSLHNFD